MNTLFVIPHMGRSELLRQTLTSIAEQVSHAGSIEVVVVTKEASLDLAAHPESETWQHLALSVLHAGRDLTISGQRNLGARQNSSDHLAFIDADIQLAPDWLATMQHLLYEADGRVIVAAVQRCSNTPTTLESIRTDQANVYVDTDLQHLPGRNLFMRREHFECIGGFPEHLITCEDYYFTGQAARLGALWSSSRSSYVHLGEDRHLLPMFGKEVWRGASNLQSVRGRPVGLSELPSFLVPVWTLIMLVASLILPIAGHGMATAGTALCFLTPALLYAIRLRYLTGGSAGILAMVLFYCVYFTARGLGMFIGLGRLLSCTGAGRRWSAS